MAGAPAPTLDELGLRALWDSVPPAGQLPALFLVLPAKEDGTGLRVTAFLVRVRSGGFMVALPDFVEVSQFLREQWTTDGSEACAIYPTEVLMENPRGRVLTEGPCALVDLVWEMARLFMRAHPSRSSSTFELLRFCLERPALSPSAISLAGRGRALDSRGDGRRTAGDYVTGLSEEELLAEEDQAGAGGGGPQHLDALQRRVAEPGRGSPCEVGGKRTSPKGPERLASSRTASEIWRPQFRIQSSGCFFRCSSSPS